MTRQPQNKENQKGFGRAGYRLRPSVIFTPHTKGDNIFFTLRARIVTLFIAVTLVPMALLSYFNHQRTQEALHHSANELLKMAAVQSAGNIDNFISFNTYAINDEAQLYEFTELLYLSEEMREGSLEKVKASEALTTLLRKQQVLNKHIFAYYLLNRDGEIVVSTSIDPSDTPHLGLHNAEPYSYNLMISTGYSFVSPVLLSEDGTQAYMYFAARVVDAESNTIGVLISQYDANALQTILEDLNGVAGENSYAVLFDENNIRLANGRNPGLIFTSVTPLESSKLTLLKSNRRLPPLPDHQLATNNVTLNDGLSAIYQQQPFFIAESESKTGEFNAGVVEQVKTRSWLIVFMQPQSSFLAPLQDQTRSLIYISSFFLVISLGAAIFTTQRLTRPITRLTKAAERVSAGDLWIQAPEGRDEVGVLGKAFNSMTMELRRTLEGLEHRVAERTAELAKTTKQSERRSEQLQTVADVAHAIASITEPEELLNNVTHLISERFSYYHVGIFLIDNLEYAVLQAANSEGGQRMLGRNHRLKVGQVGIVGYVTASGEARIALDVGEDAVYFDNPDLPYTRSEMALPLKVGNRVIGALDVQSMEQAAFSEEDVALLGTLADQVAIAIENVRLFNETKNALAEMQSLHRQYLREEWSQVVIERGKSGYEYQYGKLVPIQQASNIDLWLRLENRDTSVNLKANNGDHGEGFDNAEIITPITVRGQVIGALNLFEDEPDRDWTEDEMSLIRAVADQVGLAIENARLIEQTLGRAEREHRVSEITTRLRASNDPQVILETAARELKQALRAKQAQVTIPTISRPSTKGQSPSSNGENEPNNTEHPQT
jgi:GAF domain-containing protein/HAMP domain-containing protein